MGASCRRAHLRSLSRISAAQDARLSVDPVDMQVKTPCEICAHCNESVQWERWSPVIGFPPQKWQRTGRCGCGERVQIRTTAPLQAGLIVPPNSEAN